MAAIDDLQTAWETEIAKISDTLLKAEATYALSSYVSALTQQSSLEANDIQSYSISGRSITRRNVGEGRAAIQELRNDLVHLVYGDVSLVDLNTEVAEP